MNKMEFNLADKAYIVRPKISVWTARKKSSRMTTECAKAFDADKGVLSASKRLSKSDTLIAIGKVVKEFRQYHTENTLPWDDAGARLLPAKKWIDYTTKAQDVRIKFERLVKPYISEYLDDQRVMREASTGLGDLFDAKDYPDDIGRKFKFELETNPVPQAKHFVVDAANKHAESIARDVEVRTVARIESGVGDLVTRTQTVTRAFADAMNDGSGPVKKGDKDGAKIFRDTITENIASLVEVIPSLNLSGDKKITEACAQLGRDLAGLKPADLRQDKTLRKESRIKAEKLMAKLDGYFTTPSA